MSRYHYYTTYGRDYGGSDYMGRLNNRNNINRRSDNQPTYYYSTTSGDYGRPDYSTYDGGYGRSDALDEYLRSVYGVNYRQPIWTERYDDTDYYSRDYSYGNYGNRGSYTYGDGGNGSYGSPRHASDRYREYDNSYDARYSYDDRYGYDNYYSNDDRNRSHRHDRYDNRDRGYRGEKQLNVKSMDLRVAENSFDHHTYKYEAVRKGGLVIRRGEPFDISLTFNRDFHEGTDSLRFIFKTVLALDQETEKGVVEQCMLGSKYSDSDFKAVLRERKSRDEIIVSIYTSANCIVSTWKMCIETVFVSDNEATSVSKTQDMNFIVLFNPWCKDDDVYFPNEQLLKEYIENDTGVIFQGTSKQIGGKPWFFGQFEDKIVETCIHVVQKAFANNIDSSMGDVVKVSRAISRIVNSTDDNGVLTGNWSGDYTGGVPPLKWSSSIAILLEHMETNRPVRFGQCFVFSGIVTTVCRALGIPCRSVTNFKSAHDTDGNTIIDSYLDMDTGRYLDSKDSIWNFHVWNDAWFKRKDLPNEFSGWQVIDATPQERSDGKMQCGPVSLKSIKEGFTKHLFDAPFVFAEVNGDRVTWGKSRRKKDPEMLRVEPSLVGKKISTKYPDGRSVTRNLTDVENIRYDITDQYKYKDGSQKEREIVKAAAARIGKSPPVEREKRDIEFEGFDDVDHIMIGSDFEIGATFKNVSYKEINVDIRFVCEAETYTGHSIATVRIESFSATLPPNRSSRVAMPITYRDYGDKINEQAAFKISISLRHRYTGQTQSFQDDIRLRRPDLRVDILERRCTVNKPVDCRLSFTNPLPYSALKSCTVTLEGSGIKEAHKPFRVQNISPKEQWSTVFAFTPIKPGNKQLIVTLNTDLIQDISGTAEINVN